VPRKKVKPEETVDVENSEEEADHPLESEPEPEEDKVADVVVTAGGLDIESRRAEHLTRVNASRRRVKQPPVSDDSESESRRIQQETGLIIARR
jgi:hypothetical protein